MRIRRRFFRRGILCRAGLRDFGNFGVGESFNVSRAIYISFDEVFAVFAGDLEVVSFDTEFEATKFNRCALLSAEFAFVFDEVCSIEFTSQPNARHDAAIIKIKPKLRNLLLFSADIAPDASVFSSDLKF